MQIKTLSCIGLISLLWQIHFLKKDGWHVASMISWEGADMDNYPSAVLIKND